MPPVNPCTTPVLLTVAILPAPELHPPPLEPSANDIEVPAHRLPPPVIDDGEATTVTDLVTVQPIPSE